MIQVEQLDKKYKFVVYSATLVSIPILAFVYTSGIPIILKMAFALVIWGGFFIVYHNAFRQKRITWFNIITYVMLGLALYAIIRSMYLPSQGTGNKWLTLFGNELCALFLIAPLFSWISYNNQSIVSFHHAITIILFCGLFYLFFNSFQYIFLIIAFPFLFYSNTRYKFLFIIYLFIIFYRGFFIEETSRTGLLAFLIVFLAYFAIFVIKKRALIKTLCLSLILLPMIYAIMTIVIMDFSLVGEIIPYLSNYTDDGAIMADTRTFLFKEVAEDLSSNNAWLFGKGALSHYFSQYFFESYSGESETRINCEVTLLLLLIRGGITYAICYYALIITAVFRALKHAKNNFSLCICAASSGWILISCISDVSGCSIIQIGFFILLGTCFSDKWLNYTDNEIFDMLNKGKRKNNRISLYR